MPPICTPLTCSPGSRAISRRDILRPEAIRRVAAIKSGRAHRAWKKRATHEADVTVFLSRARTARKMLLRRPQLVAFLDKVAPHPTGDPRPPVVPDGGGTNESMSARNARRADLAKRAGGTWPPPTPSAGVGAERDRAVAAAGPLVRRALPGRHGPQRGRARNLGEGAGTRDRLAL